ncbi:hypothetical protein [Brevundimonas bacteroides]|uniref:hypothetical protein n=1 Tax=Brevundimonas bacteroides TaxID=74311 RepID=UPI0004960E9A|nr:hypothetical protein [Brevundimonas bacteroides]
MSATKQPTILEALARDAALVLKSLGGSAHESTVIDCVAALRRQRGETVGPDLGRLIVEAFQRYSEWFARPFGEGSKRWALIAEPA